MPIVSIAFHFRQSFRVAAEKAYGWCADFGPDDGALFSERTRRSVRWLTRDALVMTDTTYRRGRPLRIRRLVRLNPPKLAWTSTHLDGPYQGSQYWYRIVSDGRDRSHLEFDGLRLERHRTPLSPTATARRAEAGRRFDSEDWRRQLAPALERDIGQRRA